MALASALALFLNSKEEAGTALGVGAPRSDLETDVPAPLPHHLLLHWLFIASSPELHPHAVIDVEQVVGVFSGIPEHLLGQRPTMRGHSS